MRKILFITGLCLAAVLPSLASASQWLSSADTSIYGQLDFQIFIPTHPNGALVVALHGCHQDANLFSQITQFNTLAETAGITVLYPEQSPLRNADLCWNWFLPVDQVRGSGEPYMIAQATVDIVSQQKLDPSQVYIAGMSSGGAMAHILASCYSDIYAAVAIHSGVQYLAASDVIDANNVILQGPMVSPAQAAQAAFMCSGKVGRMMPALIIQGTQDTRVTPKMEGYIFSELMAFNDLLDDGRLNGSVPQAPTQSYQLNPPNQYPYIVNDVTLQGGTLIQEVEVQGMAHAWSGGAPGFPNSDPLGPNATQMIWNFFQHFRRTQ